jgi:sugar phosphate isomerase/epimerase
MDGRLMLKEIRDLGFARAELSHGIRVSLLPGIFEAVDSGEIQISTLHNFCPLPIGVDRAAPNLFQFSAPQPRERESAYRHTMKTLETATRVNAPVVVLHLGSVEARDYTEKLVSLLERGQKDTPKYERLLEEAQRKIEDRKQRHMELVFEMLQRIIPEAASRGIRLGVENREALEELPLDGDLCFFFKELNRPDVVGYWHDTGHAQIKENLGIVHHAMQLSSLAGSLLGFHIHDVHLPASDHRAPGTGVIDWAALKPMVRPEHLKVFEFSPSLPPEAVQAGIQHVKNLWGMA